MELRVQDGHGDFATIHTYPLIDKIFSTVKSHVAKRERYYLLCKEMTYDLMYIVKSEQQNGDGPEEPIFYWVC